MAKYTYRCRKYGHITEHEFPMGENPEWVVCGERSKKDLNVLCKYQANRYISKAPPITYNGTGFASTAIPRKSGLEDYEY